MSFSKIDLEFSQVRLNCVLLIPLGIRLGVSSNYAGLRNARHRSYSVNILALFAYVYDKSGIFLKVVGQNTVSSPSISMCLIESRK